VFSNGGALTLVNDTFTQNTASGGTAREGGSPGKGYGGAVFARNGTLTAVFTTFSGNTAADGGTDIYVLSDLSNGGNNTSPGASQPPATATLIDDILGQSTTTVPDFVAAVNDTTTFPTLNGSNDFVSLNASTTSSTEGLSASALIQASTSNPLLAGLASNGGPTQTLAILPGSPVLAQGAPADFPGTTTAITTDQRGLPRIPGRLDLGAFQFTSKVSQTIAFAALPAVSYGVVPLALSASASSGEAVAFRVRSGVLVGAARHGDDSGRRCPGNPPVHGGVPERPG
jgi:hypothetical protein